uniref:Hypothetical secreted protein of the basic tail family n=1 Tax=Hyalomma rufipes TaxID=72862 RepID=E2J6R2_HYARU
MLVKLACAWKLTAKRAVTALKIHWLKYGTKRKHRLLNRRQSNRPNRNQNPEGKIKHLVQRPLKLSRPSLKRRRLRKKTKNTKKPATTVQIEW